jgi:hypothetical protein
MKNTVFTYYKCEEVKKEEEEEEEKEKEEKEEEEEIEKQIGNTKIIIQIAE